MRSVAVALERAKARAQARVNHPHVAHIYYVSTDHETPFLAMELVGTHTLAQRLKYGPLPFPDVARFALQVAEALEHILKKVELQLVVLVTLL